MIYYNFRNYPDWKSYFMLLKNNENVIKITPMEMLHLSQYIS